MSRYDNYYRFEMSRYTKVYNVNILFETLTFSKTRQKRSTISLQYYFIKFSNYVDYFHSDGLCRKDIR